jgi:hypothetical protein
MTDTTQTYDRIGGLIWVVFGAAIVYGSWTMDRLESLKIPLSTAPGVPTGLLGICFIILGLVMLLRRMAPELVSYAEAAPTGEATPAPELEEEFAWNRALFSGALCLLYAGLLLGRGLPYWLLTCSFLFLHMVLLDETGRVPARPTKRRLITAAIVAPIVTVVVMLVFEKVFLVRLP